MIIIIMIIMIMVIIIQVIYNIIGHLGQRQTERLKKPTDDGLCWKEAKIGGPPLLEQNSGQRAKKKQ